MIEYNKNVKDTLNIIINDINDNVDRYNYYAKLHNREWPLYSDKPRNLNVNSEIKHLAGKLY